ncbi:unnamed protein product [Caenorhabditis auriculariae]|uniref:2-oxoacid dehydrogenase acyltransferase catalytic domain-containing protein n=1 Tax=Caenorhabditis auriculariae TaxID=2777116 RepID=A0A8S1HFY5_9PELO|nr:unnamed protein product [Caenorhabditis auriculariae]
MNVQQSANLIRSLSSAAVQSSSSSKLCGPAVKLLILQYGLEERDITGSGPKKNVLKSDLLELIKKESLSPIKVKSASSGSTDVDKNVKKKVVKEYKLRHFEDVPLTTIRSTIAKRLSQSKQQIPHEYQAADVRIDKILAFRKKMKTDGVVFSLNDLIVKAAALALRAVPEINVRYENEKVVFLPSVDVSVAVATPTGLITPIIKNADVFGVQTISNKIKELSNRARENKLQLHEFQGGSFTISNLGMYGSVTNFTAIINPPQCAILTIGGSRTEVMKTEEGLETQKLMGVTLCFDGRAIEGTKARDFLLHFSNSLADPDLLIAEPLSPALDFDFSRLL